MVQFYAQTKTCARNFTRKIFNKALDKDDLANKKHFSREAGMQKKHPSQW